VRLLTIGEFARASRLSPKALRLYDELGLLRPVRVDEYSGYRYYSPDQLDQARLVAWLRRAGLPVDDTLVRCDDLSADGGLRQARALLSVPDAPTAIVAGNDAQAFGVLQALAERGRRCPDDLSVTGFNDLPIATWAAPPLTTIRQPLAAMAATAFWMLTSSDAEVQPRHLELETTLVVRQSTAPPR